MRDGIYICESCHRKIKRNKVPCHTAADRQIIRESRTDIQTMSADRCRIQVIRKSSLCKKIFVARMLQKLCQSHDQNWYFKNSKFETKCQFQTCTSCKKTISGT